MKEKSQKEKFIEKARELGCDEDPKAFEDAFSKVVPPKRPNAKARSPKLENKKPRAGRRG
jgi:hypothetical protein